MRKCIESITPVHEGEVQTFYHQLYGLRRVYESGAQDVIAMHQKTLLYSTRGIGGKVNLTLDHRGSYEVSPVGRVYDIEVQGDFVLITFQLRDEKENILKTEYVGIKGVKQVELTGNWKEKTYAYDEHRKAQPTYWVYDALTFVPKHKVVFSTSEDKAEARTLCDIAMFHFDEILSTLQIEAQRKMPDFNSIYNSKQHSAASMSAWSLQQLHQQFQFDHRMITGIYAGYPWFFQLWSRDELISLGGLIELARQLDDDVLYKQIKDILSRHVHSILANGTLANRYPHSDLGSIDAFGWLGQRIIDFINVLSAEKKLYTLFDMTELIEWYDLLKTGLKNAKESHFSNGFFRNEFNETWMDTSHNDDGRTGYRIEIQALHYCIYSTIIMLGKLTEAHDVQEYVEEQKDFKINIRNKFLVGNRLVDGFNKDIDWAYRPNIFLAGFVAFDLFTKEEWKQIAHDYLEALLTHWGGLRTIEPSNALYQPYYTGQTNESYHRGDSWYFVNNLAAIVLHRIDARLFKEVIDHICVASATDILDIGFMGHASEVSSAEEQKAEGCLGQAWSVGTYLELMAELYPLFD